MSEESKMSFSSRAKDEICKNANIKSCCAVSECYGVMLFCNTFSSGEIKIVTESRSFSARLPKLLKKAFKLDFDFLPQKDKARGKLVHLFNDRNKINTIFEAFGYSWESSYALHINLGVLERECCKQSFVRGAFLAGGSVTDPEKRYHLELLTTHYHVSRELYSLFLELGFKPKQTMRGASYISYFKQSEAIEDMLTMLGAPVCAMEIMQAKVEKGIRNVANRRVNCDTANLTKAVDASISQVRAIRRIESGPGLQSLSPKLYETALLRLENPEATLSELAQMSDPPITKSSLHSRLKRIIALSERERA